MSINVTTLFIEMSISQTDLIDFYHCVAVSASNSAVSASKKRQTKSGGLGGRRQSPKSFTSARRKKTASAEAASSDSDQGYLKISGFDFFKIIERKAARWRGQPAL